MNKLKKIFVIIAAIISIATATFAVCVKNTKSNVCIAYGSPFSVLIYDHSTVGKTVFNNVVNDKDEAKEKEILDKINNLTNVSVYDKLIKGISLDHKIIQAENGTFTTWSTDIKNGNTVVELYYNSMQDLVVYYEGYTRVISYYCLALVLPQSSEVDEIIVYYSLYNSDVEKENSYKECSPFILYGETTEFLEYIKQI